MLGLFDQLGAPEILIILAVFLLLFGAKKLPELARSLGKSSTEFKKGLKEGGKDVITTVYFGEGPPDKYQTTGVIDSTSWSTGQPMTNVNVIVCTFMQVVYTGVNLTTPSTCAQTNFA